MNTKDKTILQKIKGYCIEIAKTHEYFRDNIELFYDKQKGFVYRNSITMPILQIGELAKSLSGEFITENDNIP